MKRLFYIVQILCITVIALLINTNEASAAFKPQDVLKKKFPNETIKLLKSADLNSDKKLEHFILTDSGNFYMVNSKGILVLVNTNIISDEGFDDPEIKVFAVNAKEKHVAVTCNYGPSNTQMYVYRLKDGGLVKALDIMGDLGILIDSKGRIHMYWKKYKLEGGWDEAEAVYTWNSKTLKYKATGETP